MIPSDSSRNKFQEGSRIVPLSGAGPSTRINCFGRTPGSSGRLGRQETSKPDGTSVNTEPSTCCEVSSRIFSCTWTLRSGICAYIPSAGAANIC